jgi:hypothetical protein
VNKHKHFLELLWAGNGFASPSREGWTIGQCRQLMEQKGKAGVNIDEKDLVNI